jgi:hypothetical protein
VHQESLDLSGFPKNIDKHFISSVTGEQTDEALLDISDLLDG